MSILKLLYSTVLDALFPISKEEEAVLAMTAPHALAVLPRSAKSPIHESCSIFSYRDERVSRLIWSIKYKKSKVGAKIAAYSLMHMLAYYIKSGIQILIIPMPITPKRRRERGFNQCELIADEMRKLDIENQLFFDYSLLKRHLHKSRQTLKDRSERLENAIDIFVVDSKLSNDIKIKFSIQDASAVRPKYLIIVIDDVVTTGSTIRDAVATLRKAGFEKTFGLSVAH